MNDVHRMTELIHLYQFLSLSKNSTVCILLNIQTWMHIILISDNAGQFRPPIVLRTDLLHITTELWEISVLRMAH